MNDRPTSDSAGIGTVTEHPDGSVEVDNDYINVRIWPSGSITSQLKKSIRSIALENIIHVRSYRIMRVDDLKVHNIEFDDGGTVDLRYTDAGDLVHFEANTIGLSVSPDGDVTLKRHTRT